MELSDMKSIKRLSLEQPSQASSPIFEKKKKKLVKGPFLCNIHHTDVF